MTGDTISVRFAKCPMCGRVHTERSNVITYNCAGCGTVLRAPSYPRSNEEPVISSDTPPPESPNIRSQDISASDDGDSSEAKSSAPPELSPPATFIPNPSSHTGSLSSLEDNSAKRDKQNPLSRRTFKTSVPKTPESSSGNSAITCFDNGPSSPSFSSDSPYNDLVATPASEIANLQIDENILRDLQSSPWTERTESSWRGGSHHREEIEVTPGTINNDGRRDRRSDLWRWSLPPKEMVEQDQAATWPSFGDMVERSWSEGSRRSEEQVIPPSVISGGRRVRRSNPLKQSFSTEEARPQLPRWVSLEDEGESSRSGGNRSREGSVGRQPVRRHCRAVAGAAPLVLCGWCDQLLHLPVDFGFSPGRRTLQCGACENLLTFWFSTGGRLRPARSCHD